ncbi:SecDF P1 head subdomain-containing protein [Microtetraspora fusca]|uniref:SecDF P1 head subdomain-containing protein n=1 Tax=Microtetraspora fusca TaxID=1997 RepID=UPI00082AC803|nr:excalibur calcium-binding domain-containing protein [Microtetraspora fusca]
MALVLVVVMTGVLGAVAVLMTRNPDSPPLSRTPLRTLRTSIHFAPVTGVRAAPCTGTDAVPDDAGTTCYQLDPGVTVTSVQKIERVTEQNGTFSVRIVLSPATREQVADLTRETVKQQLAIVVGDKVIAAPRVAQEITQDSLSIAGFTEPTADALIARLLGSGAGDGDTGPTTGDTTGTTGDTTDTTGGTGGTTGGTGDTTGTTGGTGDTTGTTGGTTGGTTDTGTTGGTTGTTGGTTGTTGGTTGTTGGTGGATGTTGGATGTGGTTGAATTAQNRTGPTEPGRFATCREAVAAGYGPYTRGVHKEYDWYDDVNHNGVACDRGDL